MKRTINHTLAGVLAAGALVGASQAATIDVLTDFVVATVAGDPNTGGLGGSAGNIANGSARLNLLVTIDDTGGTGSVYSTVLTLAGTTSASASAIDVNAAGLIDFDDGGANTNTMTMTIGPISKVSGPDAIVVFDGFKSFDVSAFSNTVSDKLLFNSEAFTGSGATSRKTLALASLQASPSTISTTAANLWRMEGLTSTFTVTPIPEPSTVLLGLAGLGIVFTRRR